MAKIKTRETVSYDRAKKLMSRGNDLLDPRDLHHCPLILPRYVPPLEATDYELKRAKECDESVVPLLPATVQDLYDATGNLLSDGGELLYEIESYQDEAFFRHEQATGEAAWFWFTRVELTSGTDFLKQSQTLANVLASIYAGRIMPRVYEEARDELA